MNIRHQWVLSPILLIFLTLSFSTLATEEESSDNSSSNVIETKELEIQCAEQLADQIIPDDEDRKQLLANCVDEKSEALRKLSNEQG